MAVFNPELPNANDPNYLRYSKVVDPSPVIADTSKGEALKSIGAGVSDVIGVADRFVKNQAVNEAEEGARSVQDIYTQVLKSQAPTDIIPQPVQTASGAAVGGGVTSLLDYNSATNMPSGVSTGIQRAQTLGAANNNGKINDTYYTAQLTALAKNLRSKYPGYRDYIDQEISHVTGMNPAKEYINNLMQDINAQRTQGQKTHDEVQRDLMEMNKSGVSGAYDATIHFMQTGDMAGALRWMNTVKSDSYKATAQEQALTLEKATDAQTKDKMEKTVSVKMDVESDAAWSAASLRAGVDTPEAIQKMVTDKSLGVGGPIDSTRMQAAALNITAQKNEMLNRFEAMGSAPLKIKMNDGSIRTTTYKTELGPEKWAALLASKTKRYDVVSDAITNDKTGTATFASTVNQRVKSDYENGVITDPANRQLLAIDFLNKSAGPNWSNIVTTQALKADVDATVAGLFRNKTVNAAAGPRPGLPAPSFKNDIEEAVQGKNTTDGKSVDPQTKYFDRLLENVNLLGTPTTDPGMLQGKLNIAKYFFDPQNIGTLSNLKLDVYDDKGNKIPGRESMFRVLSSPETSRSIKELSKSDPQIERNYKDYIEYEWGQKIFSEHLNQMKDFLDGTAGRQFTDPRGVNVTFVSSKDKNQIVMTDNSGKPITGNIGKTTIEQNYYNHLKYSVDKINEGLVNLTKMHSELGGDTGQYLLRTMENAGIDVSKNKLGQAIVNSNEEAQKKFEQTFKNFKTKGKPNDVGEPTLSPTGSK